MRFQNLAMLFFGSAVCFCLSCREPQPGSARFQFLLDSLYRVHPESRGLLVSVLAPNKKLNWQSAVGPDSSELKPNSPLLIASITKLFTAAATWVWLDSMGISHHAPIQPYLSAKRDSQMRAAGYATEKISFGQVLSCTAGLADYVETKTFQERTVHDPGYHWTRDEQIELAFTAEKRGEPGEVYAHADVNFLLLAEILEEHCGKPFYTAIRDLLELDAHGLDAVYFNQLERRQAEPTLVQQFASSYRVDSYTQDPSFDLFGGGGMRSSMPDLARFTQLLYQGKLFPRPAMLHPFLQAVHLNSGELSPYGYGQMHWFSETDSAYGHGGFWGTMVHYFPADSCSIAVSVLDRDAWKLNLKLIALFREEIKKSY